METLNSAGLGCPMDSDGTAAFCMDVEPSETTDSGVHSDATDMNASMVLSGSTLDGTPVEEKVNQLPDNSPGIEATPVAGLTRSDIENSNIPASVVAAGDTKDGLLDDPMVSSQCSTFDTTETQPVRRRPPKRSVTNPPKKRVSFHEDILKNTKTDNIHIEHGFITYKNGVRANGNSSGSTAAAALSGRYSWCAKGTDPDGEFQDSAEDPEYVIYRNACSEVLDYGKTDIYDDDDAGAPPPVQDNSGVFEYADTQNGNAASLYKCHCSDSNSSLESSTASGGAVDVNSNEVLRGNYAQTKSNSCECIGHQKLPQKSDRVLTDNCYYSEPNVGTGRGPSVWSKEKKPKSSCLKKTNYASFDAYQQTPEAVTHRTTALKSFNLHASRRTRSVTSPTTPPPTAADNGKSIFGSLKNIFGIPLPERGVPEGQEDAQAVQETVPEAVEEEVTEQIHTPEAVPEEEEDEDNDDDDASPVQNTSRTFLSKSFDGGFHEKRMASPNKKTFIHSVDEQLRKKSAEERASPKRTPGTTMSRSLGQAPVTPETQKPEPVYRNKFIVNCESTVFEHTGVSYSYEDGAPMPQMVEPPKQAERVEAGTSSHSFLSQKISKWTNMFRSSASKEPPPIPAPPMTSSLPDHAPTPGTNPDCTTSNSTASLEPADSGSVLASDVMECSFASSNSTMTDVSSLVSTPTKAQLPQPPPPPPPAVVTRTKSTDGFNQIFAGGDRVSPNATPTRHLPSPRRSRPQPHYPSGGSSSRSRMSPDLFNNYVQLMGNRAPVHDLRTSSLLSEDFDDILTVTTTHETSSTVDRHEDMVIVDYPEITIPDHPDDSDYLKPASSKSSLINRFLRNVTQKKIMEATVALNRKLVAAGGGNGVVTGRPVAGRLYVKGVRPIKRELIEDLNAEIAMEIEQSKRGDQRPIVDDRVTQEKSAVGVNSDFDTENGFGVGEIPVALFKGVQFPFIGALLPEFLMKVFKLYVGYDKDGIMTPVLVFLTNKTLYVTDLVRSKLCNKFVMPYAELDVILLGPYGNTVLLCNGDRDMQQVLLAGGPNQANALVSSLELCARRGGLQLPSIGQLTLNHLAPLQQFVRENSKTVDRREQWLYYAVVSISPMTTTGGCFAEVQEQLGANINGPLMHRSMNTSGMPVTQWSASYFLLKAGVLYMFPTTTATNAHSTQRLPSWAVTLTECQGVRRMMNAGRPHCFELLLKTGALQLAGSDEYAASDWMQALVQSASGLFELEEKRSHYGCTLVLTSSHIITLREDFTEPLKRKAAVENKVAVAEGGANGSNALAVDDSSSRSSSAVSTPNRTVSAVGSGSGGVLRKRSGGEVTNSNSINGKPPGAVAKGKEGSGYGKMFSAYGKAAGMEILSCADIGQLSSVKVSERASIWWCSLEFSCQECVQENSDVVVHFATESEHERFLTTLEEVWRARTRDGVTVNTEGVREAFPLQRLTEDEDTIAGHCTKLFTDINRMWDPLITAALGYPK